MVPFFIQIKCKLGQSYVVANALAEAEIASEIYSTAGHFDLLVKFYVDAGTDIGQTGAISDKPWPDDAAGSESEDDASGDALDTC